MFNGTGDSIDKGVGKKSDRAYFDIFLYAHVKDPPLEMREMIDSPLHFLLCYQKTFCDFGYCFCNSNIDINALRLVLNTVTLNKLAW